MGGPAVCADHPAFRGPGRWAVARLPPVAVDDAQALAADGAVGHERVAVGRDAPEGLVGVADMVDVDKGQSGHLHHVGRLAPAAVEEHRQRDGGQQSLLDLAVGLGLAQRPGHLAVAVGVGLDMAVVAHQPVHLVEGDGAARGRLQVLEEAQPRLPWLLLEWLCHNGERLLLVSVLSYSSFGC